MIKVNSVAITMASILGLAACGSGGNSAAPQTVVQTESGNTPVIIPPVQAPPSVSLNSLFGNIELKYNFTGSSTIFSSTATFNSNSFSVSGGSEILVAIASDRAIACGVLSSTYDYLCLLVRSTDGSGQTTSQNAFVFNLDSQTNGRGVFEFCSGEELVGNNCQSELVSRPDGPLAVTINNSTFAKVGAGSLVNGLSVTEAEMLTFQSAAEQEFAVTHPSPIVKLLSDEQVQNLFEELQEGFQLSGF